MYSTSKIPNVTNFRRADLAAGGQGAPLVTIGDELLFSEYDACLNLGGFCNLSLKNASGRIAFDIAPCNIILNRLAREKKQKMDEGGQIAEQGNIIYPLLEALNSVPYYSKKAPKSLGREWINKEFWHIVRDYDDHSVEDRMKTLVMHIATQIALALDTYADKSPEDMKILVTGGGAMNPTLVDFIKTETDSDIVQIVLSVLCGVLVKDADGMPFCSLAFFSRSTICPLFTGGYPQVGNLLAAR